MTESQRLHATAEVVARKERLEAGKYVLADPYDADLRATDPKVAQMAADKAIPHPLPGVAYADGVAQ